MNRSTRPAVSLWHQLNPFLQDKQHYYSQVPHVLCSICTKEIDILDIPPKHRTPDNRVNRCRILVCGHMFCFKCLQKNWTKLFDEKYPLDLSKYSLAELRNPDFTWPCPVCNLDQRFPMCRHHVEPAKLPSYCEDSHEECWEDNCHCTREYMSRIAATLLENGCVPPNCHYCRQENISGMGDGQLKGFLKLELKSDFPSWGDSGLGFFDSYESEACPRGDVIDMRYEEEEKPVRYIGDSSSSEESSSEEPTGQRDADEEMDYDENGYDGYEHTRSRGNTFGLCEGSYDDTSKDETKDSDLPTCWEGAFATDHGRGNNGGENDRHDPGNWSEMDIDSD